MRVGAQRPEQRIAPHPDQVGIAPFEGPAFRASQLIDSSVALAQIFIRSSFKK
jgi:hypothetical protein